MQGSCATHNQQSIAFFLILLYRQSGKQDNTDLDSTKLPACLRFSNWLKIPQGETIIAKPRSLGRSRTTNLTIIMVLKRHHHFPPCWFPHQRGSFAWITFPDCPWSPWHLHRRSHRNGPRQCAPPCGRTERDESQGVDARSASSGCLDPILLWVFHIQEPEVIYQIKSSLNSRNCIEACNK